MMQVERSHRTWKGFLLYDLLDGFEEFMTNRVKEKFDWVANSITHISAPL